jgi:hypothetical protein
MAPISAAALLTVWERGESLHSVDRALTLLAAASPGSTMRELASLSLGERNARLLALREEAFGAELAGLARCDRCAEQLELPLSTHGLMAGPAASPSFELSANGRQLTFRPLTSFDAAAIASCDDLEEARLELARRCLVDGAGVELTEALLSELAARLSECDPQAEALLNLRCPACGFEWQLTFDIASFLWEEVSSEAQRLLREVHTLAAAYGWREADILALNPMRRRRYVEMAS